MLIRLSLLIALSLLLASAAQATLVLDITGVGGSGETTWTFSGSDTAGGAGDFDDDTNIESTDLNGSHWDLGSFTSIFLNDTQVAASFSNATLTIGALTRAIEDAYIDTDIDPGELDDIGVGVSGSTNFDFVAGDLVSWTGVMTVGIDLNSLIVGTYSTDVYGVDPGVLNLTVNIVPEPSTAVLMMLGLAGLGIAARRVKA
jgi:hypothetical protein